jgi:hypothetical protein
MPSKAEILDPSEQSHCADFHAFLLRDFDTRITL